MANLNDHNDSHESGGHGRAIFTLDEEEEENKRDRQQLINYIEEATRHVVDNTQRRRHGGTHNATTSSMSSSAAHPILGVKGDEFFESPSLGLETGMVNVRRPIYSHSAFTQVFEENQLESKGKSGCFSNLCASHDPIQYCFKIIVDFFPFINMLRTYKIKEYLPFDLMSGLTTGIMRIPQGIAYALLARLTPIYGLYTAYFSAIFYFIFGGSHHMAAGANGVISLMIGAGVERIVEQNPRFQNTSLSNSTQIDETIDSRNIEIAVTLTFLVGIIQMCLGVFRVGFVTNYLSDPLIGGFTTGAASHVVVSQLPTICGIKISKYTGNFNMFFSIFAVFKEIYRANIATLIISGICLLLLGITKYVNDRFSKRLRLPIPGELIVLAMAIGFSEISHAHDLWSIKVVGDVPTGFMTPRLPSTEFMPSAIAVAFPTAIVSFAIGYSISKRFAVLNDYDIYGNQEVFAFGFMNTASSFFNCFATTASMSTSALHQSLKGKTQIANLFASVLVLLTLLFVGPLFKETPECVLSVIIIINLKSILFQFADLKPLWFISKIDFLLWIATWLAVIILDVDIGLGIGVALSLITIVFRTQWPYTCILGRIQSTDIYKNRYVTPNADEILGIKIFRFEGSLYFASAEHFKNSLYKETECNPVTLLRKRMEIEAKLSIVKQQVNTIVRNNSSNSTTPSRDSPTSAVGPRSSTVHPLHNMENDRLLDLEKASVHHIILDCSVCSFIDSVGVRSLTQVVQEYREVGIGVFLANVRASVRTMLQSTESYWAPPDAIIGEGSTVLGGKKIFLSVHDAVLAALEEAQRTDERDFLLLDAGRHTLHVTRQASLYASDCDYN